MQNLRYFACVVAALGGLAVAGCSSSNGPDASLHVQNSSDFSIVEIRVTSVGSTTWGPNLLGGDILAPGESLTIDVTCGTYDALLVDESGVDCQLHSVDLCFGDASWIIRNNTCTVFGVAKALREAEQAAGSSAPATN
jgi:hypothetical protein